MLLLYRDLQQAVVKVLFDYAVAAFSSSALQSPLHAYARLHGTPNH